MAQPGTKRVAVIGAGLAGLAAAIELAERGFQVQVLEADRIPGGRIKSWRDEDGDTIEHGLHKWYNQYRNYRALMDRVGCGNVLLAPRKADVLRLTGSEEILFEFNHALPSPLNFVPFVFRDLSKLPLADRLKAAVCLAVGCSFDRRRDYQSGLDDISVGEFCRRLRLGPEVYQKLIDPLIVYMHAIRGDRASFASAMDGALFAVLCNREAFKVQGLKGAPGELVVDPMVAHLERHGGVLHLGARVVDVNVDGARIDQVVYEQAGQRHALDVDYVVSAADIAGLQPLVRRRFSHLPELSGVLELEPITVWVARLWLDRRLSISTQLVADFKLAFLVYNLSVFQKEFARRKDETVLEVVMPDVEAYRHLTADQTREEVLRELRALFPEVSGATVRKFVLNRWERTYTPHTVGSYRRFAPRVTSVENLFLAGDWVKCPEHPAIYQEKAVVTGQLAANEVLRREALAEHELLAAYEDDWTIGLLKLLGVAKNPRAAGQLATHAVRERLRDALTSLRS